MRRAILLTVLGLVLWGAGLWYAGRFLSQPVDTPAKADVIVSLGGDSGARSRAALKLLSEGYAPRILLTGVYGGDPVTRPAYLSWQAIFLTEHGVPREAILYDSRSANSWDEAVNTRKLVEEQGWRRILVVSDPPHMRRLSWVWRKVFAGSPCEVRLIPADMQGWDADRWWQNEKSGQFVLMELIKLGYYVVRHD